jgi:DNA-binding response OmpR family regulator
MEQWVIGANNRFATDDLISVLLIEDDAATAEMYKIRLELDGYLAVVAADGKSGLDMALTLLPDLIYLDLDLPNMDGFQVLRRLRADESSANIPVVILTNYDEPQLRLCGLQLGALEFLVKTETTPSRLSDSTRVWARPESRAVAGEA